MKLPHLAIPVLIPVIACAATPDFWNSLYDIEFPPSSLDRSQLQILREHSPATARRQGAREFCIELEKTNSSTYYLVVAHDRTQLEDYLEGITLTSITSHQSSYWTQFVQSFAATMGGTPVSSDHLTALDGDAERLDCFYDECMQSPARLSSAGATASPYSDTALRSADYAQQADLNTYLLNRYRNLFIRFFDRNADGITDIQVSRAVKDAQGAYATSLLYDNPMLGNDLNTSSMSVAYGMAKQRNFPSAAYLSGWFGRFEGVVHYCWLKVDGTTIDIGEIRDSYVPESVRVAVAGDSFSSGEGAPNEWYGIYNIYQWSPDRMSYYAHRSRNSHWHDSVKWSHRNWYNALAYQHKTGMYYVNQSWSGAILYDLSPSDFWRTTPTDWADYYEESTVDRKGATTLARQINAMPYADYDLFCFSHSGNDAGFSDILTQMITWDHTALDFDDTWTSGIDADTIREHPFTQNSLNFMGILAR